MGVARIEFSESVRVDGACLEHIFETLGVRAGEAAICAAMEDVAGLIQSALQFWKRCNLDELELAARQVGGIADRLGLVTLAGVSRDVAALCRGADGAALAAAVARMTRLGERSLIAIWEAQDISV